jgi:hypothetical protein
VEILAAEREILIRKKQYFNSGIALFMEGCGEHGRQTAKKEFP